MGGGTPLGKKNGKLWEKKKKPKLPQNLRFPNQNFQKKIFFGPGDPVKGKLKVKNKGRMVREWGFITFPPPTGGGKTPQAKNFFSVFSIFSFFNKKKKKPFKISFFFDGFLPFFFKIKMDPILVSIKEIEGMRDLGLKIFF